MNDIDQAVQVHQPGLGKPRFVIGDMFYRDFKIHVVDRNPSPSNDK